MAELIKVTTPNGKLMWVNISGVGKVNYNEDGREYVASVLLDAAIAKPLLEQINSAYENDHQKDKKQRSLGYKSCDEDGAANEDGKYYSFNFKTSTTYQDGKSKRITVYNSKAQKVDLGEAKIGNGSIGAISGSMRYYINGKEDGVSLWLNAVQITKFEEYVDDAGFEEQGDGFTGIEDKDTGFTGQPENPTKEEKPKNATKPRL
jgi:hypothetical protein